MFTINIHEKVCLNISLALQKTLMQLNWLGEYIAGLGLKDPLLIAPDSGAEGLVKKVSSGLGFEYDHRGRNETQRRYGCDQDKES